MKKIIELILKISMIKIDTNDPSAKPKANNREPFYLPASTDGINFLNNKSRLKDLDKFFKDHVA